MNPTSSSVAHRNICENAGGPRSVDSRRPRKLIRWAATLLAAAFSAAYLTVPTHASSDTWTAATNSNWSTSAGDANWNIGTSTAQPFANGDSVTFGDSPVPNSYTVNLVGSLTPSTITVNTTSSYIFSGTGSLGGTATITKSGTGSLILDNSTPNTNSGTITISAGTLQVGNGDALGSLGSTTASVVDNASLSFDRTDTALSVSNKISGTGSVNQIGTGTTTISGADTYTGATTVSAGTLQLSTVGSLGGSTLSTTNTEFLTVAAGATFALNGGNATFNTIAGATSTSGGIIENGGATLSTLTLDASTAGNTFAGTIKDGGSGKLALVVNHGLGTGVITLTGANSYTGGTTINAGTLAITSDASIGVSGANPNPTITFNGSGTLQLNNYNSNLNLNSTIVNLGAATNTASVLNGTITGTTFNYNGPGTLILAGNNSYVNTTINAGILQVGNGGSSGTLGSGAVVDNSSLIFNRSDSALNIGGIISGAGTVTQAGSGTVTLSGLNSYTGGTLITTTSGGTLKLGSATALGNAGNSLTFVAASASTPSNGTVDLNGNSQSVGILSSSSTTSVITNSSSTAGTLTVGTGVAVGNSYNYAGTISGSALGLTTAGGGTLTLSGTDTYGGTTTLGGTGALAITSDAAINNGTGGIVFNGGTLQFVNYASTLLPTLTGAVNLGAATGTASSLATNINATALTFSGPGTLALGGTNTIGGTTITGGELSISSVSNIGTNAITLSGGDLQVNGSLSGANGGLGTLTFTSTTNNGLDITTGNTFAVGSELLSGTSFTKLGGGTLQLGAANQFGSAPTSFTDVDGGTLDVSGFSQAIGGLGGFGTIDNLSATAATLTVGGTNLNSSFAGTIQNSQSGTVALTKTGTGTLTLSGNNTYAGGTTVSAGKLAIAGDSALSLNSNLSTAGVLQLNNYISNLSFTNSGTAGAINVTSPTLFLGANSGTVSALNGNITGSLGIGFSGPGTLILTGNNTFSGATTLTGGELSIGSQSNLANSAIAFNTGTLQITGTTLNSLTNTLTWTGANTLDINNISNTFTVGSTIGGTSLTKIGLGDLVLTGNNSAGVGTITISAGALQIGNGGTSGTLGTGNVTNNSQLILDESGTMTISNIISGSGSLVQNGNEFTILNGKNTFTGGTSINAGTVQLGTATATLGATTSGALIANGATLDINGNNLSLGGLTGTGLLTSSVLTPTVTPTLTLGGGNPVAEFDGQITGALALTQVGTGVVTLTGNNTYTGATTLSAGTLAISQDAAINNAAGGLTFAGGALQLNNYASNLTFAETAVKLGSSGVATLNNNLTSATTTLTYLGNPGGVSTLILDGSNGTPSTYAGITTIGSATSTTSAGVTTITINSAGTLQLGNSDTNGSLGSGGVVISQGSSLAFDRSDPTLSIANLISGAGAVTQQGSGILTLMGANTYIGGTTISAGTVQIGVASVATGSAITSGALGVGPVTLNTTAAVGLDLNGFSPTIGGLSGTGVVDNTSATPSVLTVAGNGSFSGTIQNSNAANGGIVSLVVNAASGTFTLSAANTYSGGTTLTSGILAITSDAAINAPGGVTTAPLTFSGGTLLINNYFSQLSFNNVAQLNLSASNTGTSLNAGISGNITGATALAYNSNTTLVLSGNNNYTGGTNIVAGTLVLGGNGTPGAVSVGLGSSSGAVSDSGELGLNGYSASIGSLSGNGFVDNLDYAGTSNFADTLTVGSNNLSTTFSGQIMNSTGALTLNKVGTGTLTLTGANSFGGGATITGGVLAVNSDSALGIAVAPTPSVTFAGGTLQFINYNSNTLTAMSGPVSLGAAAGTASSLASSIVNGASPTSLTYVGPGTLLLTGSNTYTGGTTIGGGILEIGADSAIGNGVGGVNFTGGTLLFKNYASNSLPSLSGPISLGAAAGTASSLASNIADVSSTTSSSLAFAGPGILALSGTNTYTGTTTISGGELSIVSASNIGTGPITFKGGALQITGAIGSLANTMNWTAGTNNGVDVTTGNTFTVNSAIGGANFSSLGGGNLILNAVNTYTGSTIVSGGGILQLAANTAAIPTGSALAVNAGTLDLNGNSATVGGLSGGGVVTSSSTASTLTLNNSNSTTFSGTIQGPVALAMSGTGTETLSGASTYTGGTTLNSGVLAITQDSAVNGGNVTFNGGTLQLSADNSSLQFGTQNVKLGAAGGIGSSINGGFIVDGGTTASLTYVGPGTLTLNGSNTYSGGTTIQAGTLAIGSDAAVNATPANSFTPTLSFTGGSLQLNNYSSNLTFAASLPVSLGAATGAPATLAATGALSGATALTFVGPGTLVVAGNNSYTGGTTLTGGELSISSLTQIDGPASAINFNGGILQVTGTAITSLATNTVNWTIFNGGFDVNSPSNTLTLSTAITGTGSLTKLGAGNLVASAANTYSGGTNINAGTLQLSGVGTLGSSVGALTMNGGTLDLNGTGASVGALSGVGTLTNSAVTNATLTAGNGNAGAIFSGTIGGPLALAKAGTGTLVLNGTDTYTGGTTLSAGILQLGNAAALGSAAGTVTLTSGELDLHGFSPTINNISGTASTGTIDNLSTNPSILTIAGTATNTVASVIKSTGGTAVGTVSTTGGTVTVVNSGPDTLVLTGANTYIGGTIVNGGKITLGNAAALGAATNPLTINNGGTVDMNGVSQTVGILSGVGSLTNSSGTKSTLTASASTTSTSSFIGSTFAGPISGSIALVKSGTAILTLSGTNTYTGGTTISAGTLAITSDAAINAATNPLTAVTFSGGTLQFNNYNSNLTFDNSVATLSLGAATGAASSLNGAITGATILNYAGPGTLVLNGNNNYTGGTNINAGELSIGSLNNVGGPTNNTLFNGSPINPGAINFNGGLLQVTGNSIQNLNSNAVNWGSFNGGFDIASPSNVFTVSTQIGNGASNKGVFTKAGPGTVILTSSGVSSGNNTSTGYSGGTTITGGLLQIGDGGADGSIGSGGISFGAVKAVEPAGNPLLAAGSPQTLAFNSALNITYAGAISGVGALVQEGSGILSLTGTSSSYSGGTTIIGDGIAPGAGNSHYILSANSDASLGATSANLDPKVTFLNDGELLLNNNTTSGYGTSNLTFGAQNIVLGVTNNSSGAGVTLAALNFLQDNGSQTASLIFNGPGTLTIDTTAAAFSGGTVINGGKILVTQSQSGLGSGPVTVNSSGELGTPNSGPGVVAGAVTVNSGGILTPGSGSTLTVGQLTLNSGAILNMILGNGTTSATSQNTNPTTGNDLVVVGSAFSTSPPLTLSPNLTVNVATVEATISGTKVAFGSLANQYYALLFAHQGLTAGSTTNFSGWMPEFTGSWIPGGNPTTNANTYADFSTNPVSTSAYVDLQVYNASTVPAITTATTPQYVPQAVGQSLDFYKGGTVNGNAVVTAPVTNSSNVSQGSSNFYLVNQSYAGAANTLKTNSFQAISTTILNSAPNVQTNSQLYATGFEYLAAQIALVDPPATPAPFYIGESFVNPGGLNDILPAVQSNGDWEAPPTLDTELGQTIGGAVDGSDAVGNYQGSFLSLVDHDFPAITNPSQLTSQDWTELDGSYGVDFSNDIAWSVIDYSSGTFTVVGGSVTIASTPLPSGLTGGLLLMLGMGFVAARKMRRRAA